MFCVRPRPSAVRIALCLCLGLSIPAASFAQQTCTTPTPPPIDNRDGYLVLLEEAPVHPMEPLFQRNELWVANIPDGTVSVFDVSTPASPALLTEIEVGLGPVTIRKRPVSAEPVEPQATGDFALAPSHRLTAATAEPEPSSEVEEVWVVCQSSNSVYIVDPNTRRVVDTIRVPHEPAGLVFDDTGDFAYVTLSASSQVAQIDAQTRQVTTFEHWSPLPTSSDDLIHVEEPRALVWNDGELLTLSQMSGNGTTNSFQFNNGNTIFDMWPFASPTQEPPDRDVLSFLVPNPPGPGTAVAWRMGTLNQDLRVLADGRLLVSNVDLVNAEDEIEGEPIYKINRFVRHRLSLLTPTTGTFNGPPTVIDLNRSVDARLVEQDFTCAMPNEMALDSDEQYAYVACYETANTAVVDLLAGQVVMELSANGSPGVSPHFGPRGVVLRRDAGILYVYNRGDHTLQAFDATVTAGASRGPLFTTSIGWDVTPRPILAGRRHLTNAKNSTFGTASCNTCHPDGHLDGLAWDLGDFTGDLPTDPTAPPDTKKLPEDVAPRDAKQLKVTQSLRGIEETPRFHWRGDRSDLAAFNPAFDGLLGGSELHDDEIVELEDFVFRLSYPPNPDQAVDRQYSNEAQIGFTCFTSIDSDTVATDTAGGTLSAACSRCHGMAGASGTSNQIVNDGGVPASAEDPTQLRGLFDKQSDTALVAGFPLPATGWGFLNFGGPDTLLEFVGLNVFNLTPTQEARITQFLEEFDSGLAPTTHYAWTLNAATAGSGAPDPTLLMNAATQGHNDLIVRGWINISGAVQPVGMLFNTATQQFDTDTPGLGPFTFAQLDSMAGAGQGVFTLTGTPVLSGYRLGLDREMDFLLDGEERMLGTSLLSADTDGDGFPDGYEVRLGSDPLNGNSVPPPTTVAPVVQSLTLAWNNSNVAKVRWSTDVESVSRIRVTDTATGNVVHVHEDRTFKKDHVLVARSMEPGKTYRIDVETEDPAMPPNIGTGSAVTVTQQGHLFQSSHVQQASLTVVGPIPIGAPVTYRADFTVVDETGAPLSNPVVTFNVVEWIPGAGNLPTQSLTTNASSGPGNANLTFTTTNVQGSGGFLEVIATGVSDPTNRLYFHPLDGQFGFWAQVALP